MEAQTAYSNGGNGGNGDADVGGATEGIVCDREAKQLKKIIA